MKSGIYKIENKVNGRFYIGSSIDIDIRFRGHKSDLDLNRHGNQIMQNAWNKYGKDNFEFSIIEHVENKETLIEREQYHIDSCDFDNLYNIRKIANSNLGMKWSDETRKKMSLSRIGKKNPNYGKTFSAETLKRMSESHKGIPLSLEHKNKLSIASSGEKNPNYGKTGMDNPNSKIITFEGKTQTQNEWAKEIGMHPRTLRRRLKKWTLEKALTLPHGYLRGPREGLENHKSKPVTYDGRTQTITAWAKEIGIASSTLRSRLRSWSLEKALTTPKMRD